MRHSKHTVEGLGERRALLEQAGFESVADTAGMMNGAGVTQADVLDACIVCWTAIRIYAGEAVRIPEEPPHDARGLRMEIWR